MYDDLEMKKMFNSVEGTTLMDMDLPVTKFVIKDLLPQGLAIIGGSPKVGNQLFDYRRSTDDVADGIKRLIDNEFNSAA